MRVPFGFETRQLPDQDTESNPIGSMSWEPGSAITHLFSRGRQTSGALPDCRPAFGEQNCAGPDGTVVALAGFVPLDVAIGRAVACCVHPAASWRRLPASGRVLLVAAYVSASYVTVLMVLLLA
jgi:hypothetical protein